MAVAAFQRQILEEAVLDDRNTDLAEHFPDVEGAADRKDGGSDPGEVARRQELVSGVGLEQERFLAVFGAQRDVDAALRPREADAVLAELAGQRTADHRLAVDAALEARGR